MFIFTYLVLIYVLHLHMCNICKCKTFPMFFTLKKFLKYAYFSLWNHTFDPDVAVSLEVVVGRFPWVPVMSQKSDRWSRLNWYITYSFLIYRTRTKYLTSSALYSHPVWVLHSKLTHIFPWWRFPPFSAASDRPPCGLFFIRTVGLHHLTLLCRNDMLLFSRLLSWRGPWNEISSCRSVQTGGLGGGGGG